MTERESLTSPPAPRSRRLRIACVFAPALLGIVALLLFVPPISQDDDYHDFADKRRMLGVDFFGDTASNLAFVAAGASGLLFLARGGKVARDTPFIERRERRAYVVMFAGVVLTGLGSAWYHLAPDTARLFWDRLPMTVAFMPFFCIVVTERISVRLGTALLFPLLIAGAASVVYWHLGEQAGRGDLRFYGLVQYYPMLAVPLMLLLFAPRYTHGAAFWWVLAWYALAKGAELLDGPILKATGAVSGHSLKHLFAAAGIWMLVPMLRRREPVKNKPLRE